MIMHLPMQLYLVVDVRFGIALKHIDTGFKGSLMKCISLNQVLTMQSVCFCSLPVSSAGACIWKQSEIQGGQIHHRAGPHDQGQRLGVSEWVHRAERHGFSRQPDWLTGACSRWGHQCQRWHAALRVCTSHMTNGCRVHVCCVFAGELEDGLVS